MTSTHAAGERPGWVDDAMFPFESHFVEIDGSVIHYVDEGAGPILLMLHGNPVWSFVYRDVIATLRDRFRCIALDYPGFGLSTGARDYRYLAQDHADLTVSFIDHFDLTEVTMVGHNWGGPFGLYAAQQRRERFERLVLANTWAWPLNGDPSSELFSRSMGSFIGRALNERFDLLGRHFIPAAHKRRSPSDAELDHYRLAAPTPASRHPSALLPGQLIGARDFFTQLESQHALLRDLPSLLVWADADPIFTNKYRKRWEATLPEITTTVLSGVGHFSPSDAPAEFSGAIDTWWPGI